MDMCVSAVFVPLSLLVYRLAPCRWDCVQNICKAGSGLRWKKNEAHPKVHLLREFVVGLIFESRHPNFEADFLPLYVVKAFSG